MNPFSRKKRQNSDAVPLPPWTYGRVRLPGISSKIRYAHRITSTSVGQKGSGVTRGSDLASRAVNRRGYLALLCSCGWQSDPLPIDAAPGVPDYSEIVAEEH